MQIKKKIAYLTIADPNDKHSWSGTNYYIFKTLQSRYSEVIALGPAEPVLVTFLCKIVHGISLIIFNRRFDYRASTFYSKASSALFDQKISKQDFDLIVAPAGIACIAFLKTKIPVVFIGDRVIAGTLNYHRVISNLWKWSEYQSIRTEKRAFDKAALCVFSSPWAANQAEKLQSIDKIKILVLPFGANMDKLPTKNEVLKNSLEKDAEIKLLLVGVSWIDKGVEIAVKALEYLLTMGYNAHLTIVGCVPPDGRIISNTTIVPFLNKNTKEGLAQLQKLFTASNFFILPTRFDCTPIVFCEAAAFALPVLTADTGGVAGHIQEGKNGFLIPYEDTGKGYAEKINEVLSVSETYSELSKSARQLFEERLNWDVWLNDFSKAIEKL